MGLIKTISEKYQKRTAHTWFLVSFPKSGRTWVRLFLNYYFFYKHPFSVTERVQGIYLKQIPLMRYTHGGHAARNTARMDKAIYRAMHRQFYNYRFIFLVRDPRDVFVSYYFQLTQREDMARKADPSVDWNKATMKELLYHPIFGIERIVTYLNHWYLALQKSKHPHYLLQYEALRKAPEREFRKLLQFVDHTEFNEEALQRALDESSFDKMKAAEKQKLYSSRQLASTASGENAMKVRKGKVGGYREYFEQPELDYMDAAMQKLLPEIRELFI